MPKPLAKCLSIWRRDVCWNGYILFFGSGFGDCESREPGVCSRRAKCCALLLLVDVNELVGAKEDLAVGMPALGDRFEADLLFLFGWETVVKSAVEPINSTWIVGF